MFDFQLTSLYVYILYCIFNIYLMFYIHVVEMTENKDTHVNRSVSTILLKGHLSLTDFDVL
jgi:hypothetical protein